MNEVKLLAEFQNNGKNNMEKLSDLFKAYDLAKLGYDMQKQQFAEVCEKVLAENCFYASESCERLGISAGDRVTKEIESFLLSKEDFHRMLELKRPICVERNLTDKDGYYIEDWMEIKIDIRIELVDFIINEILPEEIRPEFERVKLNIVQTDKLLNIIRPIVGA